MKRINLFILGAAPCSLVSALDPACAQALHSGTFVWADESATYAFASTASNQCVVDDGGSATDGALSVSANGTGLIARFGNASNCVADIQTNGTIETAFNPTSDRNAKEHFTPVNVWAVLEKVSTLPISEWNYKLTAGTRHVGPMAQDSQAAFNLGTDDKHIATVDADGVARAAIQGLNQKSEAMVKAKDAKIAELEWHLVRLENLVSVNQHN